ncbi:MAG: endonuclease III [Verrucomicrobia bacterium]|nr:endonuclease III [Verrucomicrobiota bacterium]
MPRESAEARSARARRLLAALKRAYPDAHCELDHRGAFHLLIATILSAQCTDKRVNRVTPALFARFPSAQDFATARLGEIEALIKSTGFFRNKARNIQSCSRQLVERHQGEVPRTMAELTALDGVGRKTANVVLGNAFGINAGVVVDTHVARLSRRLGLTRRVTPEQIEQDLMKLIPRAQWALWSHWLIWHGRRRCAARKPDCAGCELARDCPRLGVKPVRCNSRS